MKAFYPRFQLRNKADIHDQLWYNILGLDIGGNFPFRIRKSSVLFPLLPFGDWEIMSTFFPKKLSLQRFCCGCYFCNAHFRKVLWQIFNCFPAALADNRPCCQASRHSSNPAGISFGLRPKCVPLAFAAAIPSFCR